MPPVPPCLRPMPPPLSRPAPSQRSAPGKSGVDSPESCCFSVRAGPVGLGPRGGLRARAALAHRRLRAGPPNGGLNEQTSTTQPTEVSPNPRGPKLSLAQVHQHPQSDAPESGGPRAAPWGDPAATSPSVQVPTGTRGQRPGFVGPTEDEDLSRAPVHQETCQATALK